MGHASTEVRRVAGALGAEIRSVDLARPLSDPLVKEIHDAWMEHLVLFFRDQDLTPEQHKAFARHFGELHVHPFIPHLEDHPEIIVLENDARRRPVTNNWHSDVTFEAEPPLGSVLHAQIVPEVGGDTLWANMYAAYEALSDPMRRFLSGLTARHSFHRVFGRFLARGDDGDARMGRAEAERPPVEHPVIRTHPVTGRKALFVNSSFTREICGLKPRESRLLLEFLLEHVGSPEFQCRFRWRRHSIAMWDNRCTQHYAVADYVPAHRLMHRVTICGDRPV